MILAIDYGRKRIGLAVSDETETIAMAIKPIIVKTPQTLIPQTLAAVKELKAEKLLIGIPLGIANKPTQMSLEIESFAKKIKDSARIEIEFWNETATSEIVKTADKKFKSIDSQSARMILQEYLDFKKNHEYTTAI